MTETVRQRSILVHGFTLAVKHWRAIAWTYALQLALTALFTLRVHSQFAALLSPSLASARLASAFDIGVLAEAITRINQAPKPSAGLWALSSAVFAVIYFILTPGVIYSYLTGERASLHKLQFHGLQYFWRFLRISFFAGLTFLVILAPLVAIREGVTSQLDEHGLIEKPLFLTGLAITFIIGLAACVIRLYFDLVETYTVQLGLRDDRRTRRAYRPAARTLRAHFMRSFETFALLTFIGIGCIVLAVYFSVHRLAAPHSLGIFLLLQLGILLDLFTRFWQRGAVATLVLDHPIPLPVVTDSFDFFAQTPAWETEPPIPPEQAQTANED